jgi:hypothetical protein
MASKAETVNDEPLRQRKPWSTPRVILTELRSTDHQVGLTPNSKTNFSIDSGPTPSGSSGS